jgi:hypothetical protein
MDSQGFITVGKSSTEKRRVQNASANNNTSKRIPVCNWCKTPGHVISFCEKLKERNRRDEEYQKKKEERIANMTCPWCKEKGHGWDFCQKRKDSFQKKEEKQRKMENDFPPMEGFSKPVGVETMNEFRGEKCNQPVMSGWSKVAKQNRNEKLVEKINKEDRDFEKKRIERKEKAFADYLERKRLGEERKRIQEEEYIAEMEYQFGTKWFNWVKKIEDGKHDTPIAKRLRNEYKEEQCKREREMEDIVRELEKKALEREERAEAENAEMERTLSPEKYSLWRAQKDEEEFDEIDDFCFHGSMEWERSEINYLSNAPPLYREHYRKTCQKLDWREKILENMELCSSKK